MGEEFTFQAICKGVTLKSDGKEASQVRTVFMAAGEADVARDLQAALQEFHGKSVRVTIVEASDA